MIVLIDDLDRCQPDRIIETLEAIKLFLSVKKTVFVIAADNNVIQYAIRKKYPPLDNFSVNLDEEYIEKIIQLPITIPDLSGKDIENYLMLLVAQQYCSSESFAKLIKSLRDDKFLLSENVIDVPKLQELVNGYVPETSKADFSTTAEIIAGIKEIIAGNLKGNPRMIDTAGQFTPEPDVKITAVHGFHDDAEGAKRGQTLLFLIETEGLRIVHLGDLGCRLDEAQLESLKDPDVLMIPVGGFYTIDAQQARDTAAQLGARIILPMHYRTGYNSDWPIADQEDFLSLYDTAEICTEAEALRVTGGDLECHPKIVVFKQ